ncbi:MAG: AI-2E family transporter [Methylotenera sp.]|uniref:AI-2E family transporter n=1 Tax=Methylotenera sp. TaxID=2051956 RepID=UPI002487F1CD|nr:AI-2E family transporter [Methylotenera sp.]MDI1310085.1 AI-2E family transporter [Methylotenera sp.]
MTDSKNLGTENAMLPESLQEQPSDFVLPSLADPIKVNSVAMIIIATLSIIWFLDWAQSFLITLMLGILFAYTLNPLVVLMEKIRIPRLVGSTIVILMVIASIIFAGYTLNGQIQSIIAKLPEAASKLSAEFMHKKGDPLTSIQQVQMVANEMEKATNNVNGASVTHKKSTLHVVVDEPKFKINDYLWRGSLGIFGFVGQTIMMVFLAYFLLLSGNTFKRKLVKLAGPTLTRKKITVHILDDINNSIQRYMFMLLVTNLMVGILSLAVFRLMGLDNSGAWAAAAGFLHIIPYFGPVATAAATSMAAYMQFGTLYPALLVAGASMVISAIIGIFVTTWMTGRIAKMNSAAVFISLLFWAWLWGVGGMLLGVPIIVIIKVVSERIEHLQSIAELLGE